MFEKLKSPNDLDSIFQNCRDLFLNKVIRYKLQEEEETRFDREKFEFVKTGKKIVVERPESGSVVKDENGKAKFQERILNKKSIPTDVEDSFLLEK